MAMVEAQGVTHRYRAVQALSEVDLEVPEGAMFALPEPNGAGKTTLLQILMGLRRPTAGAGSPTLVMPGVGAWEISTGLQPTLPSGGPRTDVTFLSDQWVDQSEIRVFQWVPIGGYPVEIEQVADEGR